MTPPYYPKLAHAALSYPAIDNHAHPLLTEPNRALFPLQGIISEARDDALAHAHSTLASHRATAQLSKLFGLKGKGENKDVCMWDTLGRAREERFGGYDELCRACFEPSAIQTVLLDDGLGGEGTDIAADVEWHDRFVRGECKRIVRIELEAENILKELLDSDADQVSTSVVSVVDMLEGLLDRFKAVIEASARDARVAGFKSVICYRTGLDIRLASSSTFEQIRNAMNDFMQQYKKTKSVRLQQKVLNDHLVRITLQIAGQYRKPVQFHTGLGDADLRLTKCSPAHMQPIIEAYSKTPIILLHGGYPFTREAGYLTSVYENVYLDFGEVFPLVSGDGQRAVVRQVLEIAPTNKILWSSDGHWWPESYYLASIQARQALCEVLSDSVRREELTEEQGIEIVQNALFHNANRIYNLGLEPNTDVL